MDRKELKDKLPHGYKKEVAKRACVNNGTVSKFLNGKTNSLAIELAALEVLAEIAEKRKVLTERIGN